MSSPEVKWPPTPPEHDPWIFRDGRRPVSGSELLCELSQRLSQNGPEDLINGLIQAGELEAALADTGRGSAAPAAKLTDALAMKVWSPGKTEPHDPKELIRNIRVPPVLNVAPPEGFTYYALHPSDFARVVSRIPAEPGACAVVGIRSIGTTLSAMTCAALRSDGRPASRRTVRPTGHPYSRQLEFDEEETEWVRLQLAKQAQFLVVDEGPGRSGSTFLSVAETLVRIGVPRERITLIGSRQPDVQSLLAQDAAERWSAFRFLATIPCENLRFKDCEYVGGGAWRERFLPAQEWPESWTQMERLKFISPDQKTFYKFEGMGPVGSKACDRAILLAEEGFSPAVSDYGDGFLGYSLLAGRLLSANDLSARLLDRMAQYCAFRASHFLAPQHDPGELKRMVEFNVQQEFGVELDLSREHFVPDASVLVDGRMQPHEWISTAEAFIKTDVIDHGDNHFFPGPCDIAWDLAGIAIEWRLGALATDYLLERFRHYSAMDRRQQLSDYLLAYSVFAMGFCKMAMSTVKGDAEESRLHAAYARYRRQANEWLVRQWQMPDRAIVSAA